MGRWSRLAAEEFATWLNCADDLRWLDVGCGAGVLSAAVTARCQPRTVVGIDRPEGFVGSARAAVLVSAHCLVADAMSLPARDETWDVAVSGLTLNFLPEPTAAVAQVVRTGGRVAAYVRDYAEGMGFLRRFWDAAIEVDPSAAALDEGRRFPVCRSERLPEVWADAGLVDVSTAPIEVPTVCADFADLWEPLLAGQGPAPGYVASLAPADREQVRDALSAAVPRRLDGIHCADRPGLGCERPEAGPLRGELRTVHHESPGHWMTCPASWRIRRHRTRYRRSLAVASATGHSAHLHWSPFSAQRQRRATTAPVRSVAILAAKPASAVPIA
ncbi:class I SAM-dependent methyltransferase [Streptomyces roseoverticillatus]|uniref:Class I SAM-dependent methyltransferase n=1 Tax=Streptomyces roseoverticillatus TaxID=66429 RepID=A0ABV3IWK8_9ACTN